MRSVRLLAIVLALLLITPALPALAQRNSRRPAARTPAARGGRVLPPIAFTEYRLKNGLRVILHEDHSTPIVGVNIWYHVGSKNEVPGRTGFAHLFEHMMFQGSKNYNDDFFKPLQEAGASLNGSTSQDRTNYWEVVPSNFLELALFLEADRMGGLLEAMTMEKLNNQRDVVKNERRQGIDNQPYGRVFEKTLEIMYPPNHPYHWTVIGSLEDLSAASMEDVQSFFRRYYTPTNASLVIAGDFRPEEARALVEKYFGPIAPGQPVAPLRVPQPQLDKEVRHEMEDRVQLPRVYMTWHSTPQFTKDEAPLDILASILAGGKSSRLYKTLVYDQQIAQDVVAFNQTSELGGLFQIRATAKPGKTLAEIEQAINAEIARMRTQPPTAEEVERAYTIRESSFIYGMQTVGGFGGKNDQLNQYAVFLNKPNYFEEDLARYRRVKAADVMRSAKQYLTDKRLVLTVVPAARGGSQMARGGTPAPLSPREGIATPAAQTAGQTQAGAQNAASQTQPTGSASSSPASGTPAGAQPMTKAETAASSPAGGSAPPTTAAPGALRPGGTQTTPAKPKPKMVDWSRLPKAGPVPTFTLPQPERRKLSNGLEVVFVEHHELPVINMSLVMKMGAAGDPAGQGGLASLVADMMDEGTRTRSSLDISNQLADIGASVRTGAGWDSTTADLTTLARHLDRALEIYADVVANPSFPEKELERLRQMRLTGFKQRRDNPEAIADIAYTSMLYGRNHPYGHSLTGDEESLGAINGDAVRKFYETYLRPNNSTLIVVGDVQPDALMPKLERAFAGWKEAFVPAVDVTAAPVQRDRTTIYVVDRPGSAQSVIRVGHVGVPRSSPDYYPLLVLNTLLGGQFTSRINLNLREDKGYTYGARSAFDFRRGAGPFFAAAPVVTASTKESVFELMKELRGVRGEMPVTESELDYAKQAIIRGFPRSFETPGQIAGRLETVVTYGLPYDYFNNYIQNVQAVSLEDINRVANRYLDPSRMAIVVVGDRKAIEPGLRSLENLGETITFLDTEGRPATRTGEGTGAGTGGGNRQ
jgi:zinc protease